MPKKNYKRGVVTAVVQVKKYIDDHPGTGISTAQLAHDHNLSRNVLQEVFKYRFHKPIGLYKLTKRMEEGRRLLKGGQSIKEVSFQLDYASPSSFTNAFRNFFKITPREWLHEVKKHNTNKQAKM